MARHYLAMTGRNLADIGHRCNRAAAYRKRLYGAPPIFSEAFVSITKKYTCEGGRNGCRDQ